MPSAPASRDIPGPVWWREMRRDVLPLLMVTRLLFVLFTLALPIWRQQTGAPPLVLNDKPSENATGTAFDAWNRWDTLWYDDIARLGYNVRGPKGYKNVAFFPLYPLLMRSVEDGITFVSQDVLGNTPPDRRNPWPPYLAIGLLVSNICSIAAMAFLYGLVRLDHGRKIARRTVTLLALCPLSFYLFTAYSEGTFLMCAIACFYALRLQRWWQAGLWGLLAAVARPPGAVLVVPFLMVWAQAHPAAAQSLAARFLRAGHLLLARARQPWRSAVMWLRQERNRRRPGMMAVRVGGEGGNTNETTPLPFRATHADSLGRTPRRRAGDLNQMGRARQPAVRVVAVAPRARRAQRRRPRVPDLRHWPEDARRALYNALPVVVIPFGLGLFMLFLYKLFGDALYFSHAQRAWWRTFALPWETLYISVAWPLGDLFHWTFADSDASAFHDLFYEIVGLWLTYKAAKRLPRVQGVYLWLIWAVILCSPSMLVDKAIGEPHRDVLMSLPRLLLMMFPLFTYLAVVTEQRYYRYLVIFFAGSLAVYTDLYLTGGWIG